MAEEKSKVLFKFGTAAQYAALDNKLENALYFLLDTNELYRGETPFGQAHIYTGNRQDDDSNEETLEALTEDKVLVNGDFAIIRNADDSAEAFIYDSVTETWLPIGTTLSDSIAQTVTELDSRVSELESELDEVNDAVGDLEALLESIKQAAAGAFHFKGTTDDLESIEDPSEGDVYQVGDKEYAWNGTEWVELGDTIDTSAFVTKDELEGAVGDLEALIGTKKDGDTPATGIYQDLFEHADEIIPLFNGVVSGLVPVDTSLSSSEEKAKKFLNALGAWVTVTSSGQGTYTDPEGNTYNTVEEYVTYMLNNLDIPEYVWESIDS